jgi:hypothetical protein
MIKDHNDTGLAEFSVTIMLGLSLFFLGPLLVVLSRTAPSTISICLAYFSSMVLLLAIWLAIGNSPFAARLLLAMVPGTGLGLLTLSEGGGAIAFAELALIVPLASVPSFFLRSLGYRMTRFQAKSAARDVSSCARPVQFTLRQLFGLTAVVAIYAFLARLITGKNELDVDGVEVMALFAVLSLSAAAAAWAALAVTRPAIRLISVGTVTGAIAIVLAMVFGRGDPLWRMTIATWPPIHTLMVGAELILFREIGYRLVRLPPTPSASATDPALNDVNQPTSPSITSDSASSADCADFRG